MTRKGLQTSSLFYETRIKPHLLKLCYLFHKSKGCGLKYEVGLGNDHKHFRSRMDATVSNMFEINYSQLVQYEILEKLVTSMGCQHTFQWCN